MADNLPEKVDKCPLYWGRQVLFAHNWGCENCLLYGVAGCPLFRGCLSIEVNEGQSGLSELSVISWVSAVEGCPLSGVPLYSNCRLRFVACASAQYCKYQFGS